ncbi:hypothetical protein Syn6312_1728 [Synechococcus sp. PCC 6312]|nr:hypothetical protein Syn6312_1728 [Synechococcus sp. PCC 6312]
MDYRFLEMSKEEISPVRSDLLKPEDISYPEQNSSQLFVSYQEGPISPAELEGYNKFDPEFAQEYLREIISEIHHRRQIEVERLKLRNTELSLESGVVKTQERIFFSNQRRFILGSILGSVIALTAVGSATFLGIQGRKEVAIAVVGSLAGTAVIIYGTDAYNKGRKKELDSELNNSSEDSNEDS